MASKIEKQVRVATEYIHRGSRCSLCSLAKDLADIHWHHIVVKRDSGGKKDLKGGCMQIDKVGNISDLVGRPNHSLKTLENELKKVIPLCKECHQNHVHGH